MATVVSNLNFKPETAAKELRKAMKGLGTDEDAVIRVIATHNNKQRQEIKNKFKSLFGKDLVAELKSELRGNFEDAVVALMTPTIQFLAQELRCSMKGAGTDESILIELLCARSNAEIKAVKVAYETAFKRKLEKDIQGETSGHFKRLLISQCNAVRDENPVVDQVKAEADARAIFEAGEKKWGTDESVFITVLCSRSFPQLRATFEKYRVVTGKGILDSISREMSGDLKVGFSAIVNYVWDSNYYYAERLYKSMKGLGTDDKTLIRLIVTRSEIDLKQISKTFQKTYGKTLQDFIKGDCSGDYKKLLLAVLGNN